MTLNQTNDTDPHSFYWQHDFHSTLIALACLIVIMNIPVIFLFFKISSLRFSPGNTFLCGLAVADILCGVVMIPVGLLCEVNVFPWDTRMMICQVYYVCSYTISVASVYHIVAANIAKYFAIVFPMRNLTAFTRSRVKCTILLIWVTSLLAGHLPVYWSYLSASALEQMIEIHSVFLLAFAFILPIIILILTHAHMCRNLHLKSRQKSTSNGPERGKLTLGQSTHRQNNCRIAALFFLLFSVFIISWLPWYLMGVRLLPDNDYYLTLRFVAPVLNPLVFTFVKRDFRKAAASTVASVCGFKKRHRISCHSRLIPASKTECSSDNYRASTMTTEQSTPATAGAETGTSQL